LRAARWFYDLKVQPAKMYLSSHEIVQMTLSRFFDIPQKEGLLVLILRQRR